MELTDNQKNFLYKQLGSELAKLREASSLDKKTVARYGNHISVENLERFEKGEPDFGNLRFYSIMRWAAVFGKKLKIELEDFTDKEKLEAYEKAKLKLADFQRIFY